jgi:hypothetical protein
MQRFNYLTNLIAFLRGKRVTCWGRTGDQHTEWFPGVGHGISHADSTQ